MRTLYLSLIYSICISSSFAAGIVSGTISANTSLPANVVTNFPVLNLVTVGDSLTSTDTTAGVSYPVILASTGWTVLTNYAVGGQTASTIVYTYIPGVIGLTPIYTGQRTAMLICGGKNDEYNMLASASNTVAASVETTLYNGYCQAWGDGCDVVAIELPYSDGRWYSAYTNSNFATDLINLWIRQLATNKTLLHGNYVSVPITANFPAASYTNVDGSLNTNVTLDGVHFSYIGKTNEAALIAQTISNSAAWKKSSAVIPVGIGSTAGNFWQNVTVTNTSNGAKLSLADGVGTSSVAMYYNGNTATTFWQLGTVIQSGRDLNNPGTGLWGVSVMNNAATRAIILDPNDDSLIVGATNLEGFTGLQGIVDRGYFTLKAKNMFALPSGQDVVMASVGNTDTGFHLMLAGGDLKFDGATLRATNFNALGTITAGGTITGNGSGLTNFPPSGLSSYTATNTLTVTATGLTNATSDTYLVSVTAGTSLVVKDGNGNQFLAPVFPMTFPLKPSWRFTGAAVTGIAVLQSK